jgi:hypothetical protein
VVVESLRRDATKPLGVFLQLNTKSPELSKELTKGRKPVSLDAVPAVSCDTFRFCAGCEMTSVCRLRIIESAVHSL